MALCSGELVCGARLPRRSLCSLLAKTVRGGIPSPALWAWGGGHLRLGRSLALPTTGGRRLRHGRSLALPRATPLLV